MPNRRMRLTVIVVAAAVVAAGVAYGILRATGGSNAGNNAVTGTTPSTPPGGGPGGPATTVGKALPPPPVTGLKPAITGLIDPFGYPPASLVSSRTVSAFVVMANWADLQPQPGGPLVHPNAIDQAISEARASGTGLGVKIRFFAGVHSPAWALNLDGPPVDFPATPATSGGLVPRFWTARFQQAYADIQTKLAAAYDGIPEIREVTISACMTIFAEPLLRQAEQPANRQALLAAGYTDAANQNCLRNAIAVHRQVWRHTRSSMAFNPYQQINGDGTWANNPSVTDALMDDCRQQLGQACVLENNSVRAPISKLGAAYGLMYDHMQRLGAPITLQTATPSRIGCLVASECPPGVESVLDWSVSLGATALELPNDLDRYAVSFLQPYSGRLNANLRA